MTIYLPYWAHVKINYVLHNEIWNYQIAFGENSYFFVATKK